MQVPEHIAAVIAAANGAGSDVETLFTLGSAYLNAGGSPLINHLVALDMTSPDNTAALAFHYTNLANAALSAARTANSAA